MTTELDTVRHEINQLYLAGAMTHAEWAKAHAELKTYDPNRIVREPLADERICRHCGFLIFQRNERGVWDLVYVEQAETTRCYGTATEFGVAEGHEPTRS